MRLPSESAIGLLLQRPLVGISGVLGRPAAAEEAVQVPSSCDKAALVQGTCMETHPSKETPAELQRGPLVAAHLPVSLPSLTSNNAHSLIGTP